MYCGLADPLQDQPVSWKDREWGSRVMWTRVPAQAREKSGQDGRQTKSTGGAFAHQNLLFPPPTVPNRQKEGAPFTGVYFPPDSFSFQKVFLLLYLFRFQVHAWGDESGRKSRARSWGLGASPETSGNRWSISLSAKLSMEDAESDYRVQRVLNHGSPPALVPVSFWQRSAWWKGVARGTILKSGMGKLPRWHVLTTDKAGRSCMSSSESVFQLCTRCVLVSKARGPVFSVIRRITRVLSHNHGV